MSLELTLPSRNAIREFEHDERSACEDEVI
jgi:hypothetical protein